MDKKARTHTIEVWGTKATMLSYDGWWIGKDATTIERYAKGINLMSSKTNISAIKELNAIILSSGEGVSSASALKTLIDGFRKNPNKYMAQNHDFL